MENELYGLPLPPMTEGIHPLEYIVLISGINMETGEPIMTTITSNGMTIWNAVGMLSIEVERLKIASVMNGHVEEAENGSEDE